jgi:hypothetical protein
MENDFWEVYLGVAAILAIIILPLILIYDNGVRFAIPKMLFCKMGFHKMKSRKISKYYCQYCKRPRKHPDLKMIDGGKKIGNNKFRF